MDYLQNDLATAQQSYNEAVGSKDAYLDNIEETVNEFAEKNGMSKIEGDYNN